MPEADILVWRIPFSATTVESRANFTARYESIWERLQERLDREWELLIAERAAAPGLIAELWRRFPAERLRLIRSDPRFDSIGLVQALIERGRKARAPAPLLAAFEILRCSGSRSHPAVRRELQAEALCELGEIYLERREPARAESCWARAAGVVAGSVDRSTVQRHRALGAAIRAEKGPARTQ